MAPFLRDASLIKPKLPGLAICLHGPAGYSHCLPWCMCTWCMNNSLTCPEVESIAPTVETVKVDAGLEEAAD